MAKYGVYGYRDELSRKRKKRKVRIAFLITSSLIFLLVGLVYIFFFSGWLSIKEIRISGNKELTEEQIRNSANEYIYKPYLLNMIQPFSNILLVSPESVGRSLRSRFPSIEEIEVDKSLFNKSLTIEIKEREAVGIYCQKGDEVCFYFDREGVFFKESPRFSGELFLAIEDGRERNFSLADAFDDRGLLEKVNLTKDILDELKFVSYRNFFLPENSFEFWVKTKESWDIYLDKESDIPTQLVALKKFLEEKLPASRRQTLQYIDLRVNNRIYYK